MGDLRDMVDFGLIILADDLSNGQGVIGPK